MFDLEPDPYSDYKMDQQYHDSKENYESRDGWIYLGADHRDSSFAKVGMTMKDLTSRSSSSTHPSYYIFCAFKCDYRISKNQLLNIEKGALKHLDSIYINKNGTTMRANHSESNRPSECFYDIDFEILFVDLHAYLYKNYYRDFVIVGLGDNPDDIEGEHIDCDFHRKMKRREINMYKRLILQ